MVSHVATRGQTARLLESFKIKIQRALGRTELKSEPGGPLHHRPPRTHTPPAPRIASLCCLLAPALAPTACCVELQPPSPTPRPSPQVCSLLPSNQPPLGHSVPVSRPQCPPYTPFTPFTQSAPSVLSPASPGEAKQFSTASCPCLLRLSVPLMARPILRAD